MEASIKAEAIAPGDRVAIQVAGERVMLANVDGSFYAIGDVCTHRGCSLSEGTIRGVEVTCAYHGSRYDLTTGEALSPPARGPVKTYHVSVSDGNITVTP